MSHSNVAPMTVQEARSVPWGENPIALTADVLERRIYAPAAYAPVRDSAVVPVVHSEAYRLAAWFPTVWRRSDNGYHLVAVRALMNDQRAQPSGLRNLTPLILNAYPFVFEPSRCPEPGGTRMLDDCCADSPTDVGATITTVIGKLSRATVSRFQVLDAFARELPLTRAIAEALAERDLFEPWPLKFEVEKQDLEVPDLFIVRQDAFETGVLHPILESYGTSAALLFGLHRISLFRAGLLLAAARSFLIRSTAEKSHDGLVSAS